MKYIGSKRRVAKQLYEHMAPYHEKVKYWVEPFVGGANMIEIVPGKRIGADANKYLIAVFTALQNGWVPPDEITEKEYVYIRNNKDKFAPELVGFVGVTCSFGAKFFAGYARDRARANYVLRGKSHLLKQLPLISDVAFKCTTYDKLLIPKSSIIYCDPPYQNTTCPYGVEKFNHEKFWKWAEHQSTKHIVFVSSYSAPVGWDCVLEIPLRCRVNARVAATQRVEKLFKKSVK